MQQGTLYLQLECDLTDREKIAYGREIAQHMKEAGEINAALKSYQLSAKTKVSEHEARIQSIGGALMSGKEMRRIECQWEYSWEIGEKFLYRLDTHEQIRKERIEDYERQEKLKLDEDEQKEEGEADGQPDSEQQEMLLDEGNVNAPDEEEPCAPSDSGEGSDQ